MSVTLVFLAVVLIKLGFDIYQLQHWVVNHVGIGNDEPFDDSLVRHALSTRQAERVRRGDRPYLLNLTLGLLGIAWALWQQTRAQRA